MNLWTIQNKTSFEHPANGKLLQYESDNNKSRWRNKIALNDSNFIIIVQIDFPLKGNLYQFECEWVFALVDELFERDAEDAWTERFGCKLNDLSAVISHQKIIWHSFGIGLDGLFGVVSFWH